MKNSETLLLVATILSILLVGIVFWKDGQIERMKELINKTDTIVSVDTLYLEKEVRDSIPVVQYKKIIERDTLYKKEGDSIVATPQIITKVKKKSKTNLN